MSVTELFKDSFNYAVKDSCKIFTLGAFVVGIFILIFLASVTGVFGLTFTAVFGLLAAILGIITALIYNGYGLSVLRETINSNENLPEFNWLQDIVDGIKVVILFIIYMIIPVFIGIILFVLFGIAIDITALNQSISTNPLTLVSAFSGIAIIYPIVVFIMLVFDVVAIIAMARLAETGRFDSIFEFKEILEKIDSIGWGDYIIFLFALYVISLLIAGVALLIGLIPVVGFILYLLVVPAVLTIFKSRALGLIYKSA